MIHMHVRDAESASLLLSCPFLSADGLRNILRDLQVFVDILRAVAVKRRNPDRTLFLDADGTYDTL